jgi:hypothetical protein
MEAILIEKVLNRDVGALPGMNAVSAIFMVVAVTFVVQRLFENQAFPWTVKFALAPVPIPIFEVTAKIPTFAVPVMFAEVAITFVVQKLFENHAFPWTLKTFP